MYGEVGTAEGSPCDRSEEESRQAGTSVSYSSSMVADFAKRVYIHFSLLEDATHKNEEKYSSSATPLSDSVE